MTIKALHARLARLRLEKGLTLQEVADAVGCSKTHIWELEQGRAGNPTISLAAELARYYGVSLDWLVWGRLKDGLKRRG